MRPMRQRLSPENRSQNLRMCQKISIGLEEVEQKITSRWKRLSCRKMICGWNVPRMAKLVEISGLDVLSPMSITNILQYGPIGKKYVLEALELYHREIYQCRFASIAAAHSCQESHKPLARAILAGRAAPPCVRLMATYAERTTSK